MKKIGLILALATAIASYGQSIATSPYSSIGIGDQLFDNNPDINGMAGMSAAVESVFGQAANFSNPAANTELALTSFNFGINSDLTQFETADGKDNRGTTYISNISLAFPISEKTKMGFSFQPYSADGYDLRRLTEQEGELDRLNDFNGDGGLNALSVMASRTIGSRLSLGLRADYLFGTISREELVRVETLELLTDYTYNNQISGFSFTAGAMYKHKLKNDKFLNIGATYTLGSDLNSEVESLVTTYFPVNGQPVNQDTISRSFTDNGSTKLPQTLKLGLSYGKKQKWMIGVEGQLMQGEDFSLALEQREDLRYVNAHRISIGGFWLPDFNSYKSYLERITYRAGAFYQMEPYVVDQTRINKYGITFGLRLPVGKAQDYSAVNMAVELGRRGTTDNNLIQENYAAFKLGFTLDARWFQKRIYD